MEYCLNLCDIFTALFREYECVENLVSSAERTKKVRYSRLCLGSYFCDTYFVQNIRNTLVSAYPYCQKNDVKVTLTVPVFSELRLNDGVKLINQLLTQYRDLIDEVTVNDVGMLQHIKNRTGISINQGRLMQKYTRDIRYADYTNGQFRYCGYMDGYESIVDAIEFDACAKTMEVHIGRKKAVIHRDYQYATMGRICWFAGFNRGAWEKFDLNSPCDEACSRFFLSCINQEDNTFYQVGKAVFSELPAGTIETDSEIRFADFPLYLWMRKYPSSNFDKL